MLCRKSAVYLVHLVCFVYLVDLVHLISLKQPNKPNRPNKPNEPNEQARLARQGRIRGPKFEVFGTSKLTLVSRFLFGILSVVLTLGMASMAHAYCGTSSPLSRGSGTGLFEVVPSLCVSERYDSNVFYRPATPGFQRDDFVTTVTPMLRVTHNGEYASAVLNVGGFIETYVKNPGLNYIGTNDSLSLTLDNSIKRLFPNASLRIVDFFSYTPLPPGFVNPIAGTSPGAPGNNQNVYAQGILGFRTNNLINVGTVSAAYATTALTSLNASYTYAILRFKGSPSTGGLDPNLGQAPSNLFNTTTQTGTVGGTARVSELDSMNVSFSHTQSEFTRSATSTLFKIDSATLGWSRMLTPNLRSELGGGGILISPSITTYTANAALIMNSLNNSATLSYAHTAFPGFAGTGAPVIGDIFSLSAVQKLDRQWQLAESASYAHTSRGGGPNALTYDSFSAGGDIQYWMTSILSSSLSYGYTKFTSESGSVKTDFDRHVITLSVVASWG